MDVSEINFRDLFKNNPDFLFILDMEGNIVKTNNTVNTVLGYTDEDLLGKSVLMLHPPEFRNEAAEIVGKMIAGAISSCPIPLLTHSGDFIAVETRVYPGTWNSKQVLIGISRNLTNLKRSEEKFQHVFQHSRALMAITRAESGEFVDANQQFLSTLGYTKDEILGRSSKDLEIIYDYSLRQKVLDIFEKEGQLEDFELVVKTKSGALLNCLFSLSKFRIQTDEFLLTSAINITPIKKAESKLESLYEQQKLLADISQLLNRTSILEPVLHDVMRIVGEQTGISRIYIFEDSESAATTSCTFEWCNTDIVSRAEALQNIRYDQIPSLKTMLTSTGLVFSPNITALPDDMLRLFNKHEVKTMLLYPLYVESTFYGFIGFEELVSERLWTHEEIVLIRTISLIISNAFQRRQVLRKLENSELRLKLAITSANEGLWDWNNETGQVYFSDIWCSMLGYKPDEIVPNVSSWAELVHPDDMPGVMETLGKHLKGETPFYETIHRVKTKDGNWKWILDHGMVIQRNENNEPVRTIGTHIDVTQQKETENQLQDLIRTKDKLFSIIAHDLRGPIGGLLPIFEMVTGDDELQDDLKNRIINDLKRAIKTTTGLMENLLNWAASQTNSISLNSVPFKVSDLVREIVDLFSASANEKQISILTQLPENLSVFADKDLVGLVIRNLLSNAIKFTPNRGIVTVSSSESEGFIDIEIADTGVGMNKEVVEGLFLSKSFNSTQGTNMEKGSGLGLILCKEFVEMNGGQIHAESILGKGSKFTFTLPVSN